MTLLERDGRDGVPDAFLELPPLVYGDDPLWIPEEPGEVARAFSGANPWFLNGDARVFCEPRRCRVAMFHGPATTVSGRAAAFFGYFESRGDEGGDARVMRAAEAWAVDRGAEVLYGPIDFTTYGRYRLRVAAEPGAMTFPGEPYNPVDYPARLERLGFAAHQRYVTQVGPPPMARVRAKAHLVAALRRQGYRFVPLDSELWLSRLEELHAAADAIFGDNFAYAPPGWDAFRVACGDAFAARLCPESSVVALGPVDEIAGFFLIVPQYGPLVVQGAGPQRIRGTELRYATHFPRLSASGAPDAVAKTAGVMPAHRGKGLMDALAVCAVSRGAARYARWLGALIRADNASRRFADGYTSAEREYALYAKPLTHRRAAA